MTWWLVLLLAALTYLSRAAGLALLPPPPQRLERLLGRIPAPLFAGFVALSLVSAGRTLASVPILGATAGALCAVPTRSLPIILAGGLVGYVISSALTGIHLV
jgi:branched-subunit amino acid transport protein